MSARGKGELVMGAASMRFNFLRPARLVPHHRAQMAAAHRTFPIFSRLEDAAHWAGSLDGLTDASPIIGPSCRSPGLYMNGGWGTGGFKADPGAGHGLRSHDRP